MKSFAVTLLAASVFSATAYAGDYNFQTYSSNTPTTTTNGGTAGKSGSNWYGYGQQSTFSTSNTPGSNPYNSQSTTSAGVGYRF
jgi:hypothetical protein